MRLPPAEVVANWPTPNYVDPETRGPGLVIVTFILLGICTLFVVMRLYVRIVIKKSFGWDDFFIIVAYLFNIAVTATVVLGVKKSGWDRHVWDIPLHALHFSLQQVYINKLLYLFSSFFTIQSILSFCYRLADGSAYRGFRLALHIAVVVNIVAFVPFLVAQVFICTPINTYWTLVPPQGTKCLDDASLTLSGGIVKTLLDFGVTTLPVPLVLSLNLPKWRKTGVAILLSLGYVTTAAGCFRTYYIWKVFYTTWDRTWYQYIGWQAAAVETNLGIICASAPPIRPLFAPHLAHSISSIRRRLGWTTLNRASSYDYSRSNRSTKRNTARHIWLKDSRNDAEKINIKEDLSS